MKIKSFRNLLSCTIIIIGVLFLTSCNRSDSIHNTGVSIINYSPLTFRNITVAFDRDQMFRYEELKPQDAIQIDEIPNHSVIIHYDTNLEENQEKRFHNLQGTLWTNNSLELIAVLDDDGNLSFISGKDEFY